MKEFLLVLEGLSKRPLPTICAVLMALVAYLGLYIIADIERDTALEAAYRNELVATEQRCNKEKDELRREQIAIIQAALDYQKTLSKRIDKIKK